MGIIHVLKDNLGIGPGFRFDHSTHSRYEGVSKSFEPQAFSPFR